MCAVLVVLPLYNKDMHRSERRRRIFQKDHDLRRKGIASGIRPVGGFSPHYGNPCKGAAGDQGIAGEIVEEPEQYG